MTIHRTLSAAAVSALIAVPASADSQHLTSIYLTAPGGPSTETSGLIVSSAGAQRSVEAIKLKDGSERVANAGYVIVPPRAKPESGDGHGSATPLQPSADVALEHLETALIGTMALSRANAPASKAPPSAAHSASHAQTMALGAAVKARVDPQRTAEEVLETLQLNQASNAYTRPSYHVVDWTANTVTTVYGDKDKAALDGVPSPRVVPGQ